MKVARRNDAAAPLHRGARLARCTAWACSPLRRIRKGTRIIEYLGERISHEEADRRYDD